MALTSTNFKRLHLISHLGVHVPNPYKTYFVPPPNDCVEPSESCKYQIRYRHLELPENFTLEEYKELEQFLNEREYERDK